jgi:alkylated DNA repair dioxygenase AlkB
MEHPSLFPEFDRSRTAVPLVTRFGDVSYHPGWLREAEATALMAELRADTLFRADARMMYGRMVAVPRETAARGSRMPQPWTPRSFAVKERLDTLCRTTFDYVFINRYRNGSDSVAWHNDDDAEEDPRRMIASLSLGASRVFDLRPKANNPYHTRKIAVELHHGDLIVMRGDTQLFWEHRVAKDPRVRGERINLTYRQA